MLPRILLISPAFYGFEYEIQVALRELGYDVSWIDNKELPLDYHGTGSKLKILRRIYFLLFLPHIRYLRKELNNLKDTRFDILFSINCHIICPYLFRALIKKNAGIRSILFLWDSSSMYSWEKEMKYFNEVYTFDPFDSRKMKIRYKPNFYIRNKYSPKNQEHDLFYAGKFSYYRLLIIDKLVEQFEKTGIKSYIRLWPAYKIFLHSVLIYSILKRIDTAKYWIKTYVSNYEAVNGILNRRFIVKNKLAYKVIQEFKMSSNVILDLPYKRQSGYSHMLIDALANGKKILTTNAGIIYESYYNPDQIKILSFEDPCIDVDWVVKRSSFTVPQYIKDLELRLWLKTILNVESS